MAKASDHIQYYTNPGGAILSSVRRKVFRQDGLFFKDIDGSGRVTVVNDWRLPAKKRAEAYVKLLTLEEKIGQLFISDWRMGKYPAPGAKKEDMTLDASGLLDEGEFEGETIFGKQRLPGTSVLLKEWFARHLILRANPTPEDLTDYLNQLQAVAEECERFVPVLAASNSRNESGEAVFGMNDGSGVFAAWPGTLGIAAAIRGSGLAIADQFADCVRRTWNGAGLRKGYMYMADVLTDPRWQRSYGTFGEDPGLISQILEHIIPRIQGSREGVTKDGVALTIKHFPGGGARENGFDPHYAMGQWNVYPTEGSLEKYHLPGFFAAVDCHVSSMMPYYAKPSREKSALQLDVTGRPMEMAPYGFAYNRPFLQELLRRQMGFGGYVNSDTGIVHNMCWGVEMLDKPERIAFAVHAGTDLISGLFDHVHAMEAFHRGKNGYYDTHPAPEGFTEEELVLTEEAVDRAVTRTLTEMFRLGMFEDPYRDPIKAAEAAAGKIDRDNAMEAHQKSVTLLKNNQVLPLSKEKQEGKRIYAEAFHKNPERAVQLTKELRGLLAEMSLTEDPAQADYAILSLYPASGEYFSATTGYLELDICEDKEVQNVDEQGRPVRETHLETTLHGANRLPDIAKAVHGNHGKVIFHVNFTLAWQLGNVEPYADALLAGYDTYLSAVLDVLFGRVCPVGRLPMTLPRGDEVLRVNADGRCVSPNDVPGYEKDLYMPEEFKDENGKAYAYRDENENYYELDFGLSYS